MRADSYKPGYICEHFIPLVGRKQSPSLFSELVDALTIPYMKNCFEANVTFVRWDLTNLVRIR